MAPAAFSDTLGFSEAERAEVRSRLEILGVRAIVEIGSDRGDLVLDRPC
jgi:hypothetical protein